MTRAVRVLLGGGLGNQLFMYATGRALAARIRAELILDASLFRFDRTYRRVYLLDQFPIAGRVVKDGPVTRLRLNVERALRRFPAMASRFGLWDEPVSNGVPVYDHRFERPPLNQTISLRGNWQSDRYFRDHAGLVRRELFPPEPADPVAQRELSQIRDSGNPVAVGIRFYREVPGELSDPRVTIAAFRRHLASCVGRGLRGDYFVFTEEPSYFADPNCLGVPFTLITHRPRNEDAPVNLRIMAECRTFVIGYSSYHWWGAWLATPAGKSVTYLRFPGRPDHEYAAEGWTPAPAPTEELSRY